VNGFNRSWFNPRVLFEAAVGGVGRAGLIPRQHGIIQRNAVVLAQKRALSADQKRPGKPCFFKPQKGIGRAAFRCRAVQPRWPSALRCLKRSPSAPDASWWVRWPMATAPTKPPHTTVFRGR